MTDERESQSNELQESWIESLLVSATRREDHSDRISHAMAQISAQRVGPARAVPIRRWKRSLGWGSIGVAASVLLTLLLWLQAGGSQPAIAAIDRSLDVASMPTTRQYRLRIELQSMIGKARKIEADLYVRGDENIVLRHPGPLSLGTVWIGRDGTDSWMVPPVGPVLKGDRKAFSRWTRSSEGLGRIGDLHITTVLRRMRSRGHRLEMLADDAVTIPNGPPVECHHIRAERETTGRQDDPDAIELWMSRESGMAVRIIAHWTQEQGEAGRRSVLLTLQDDEPSLPANWYTAEAHYQGDRPIVRVDSSGD